MLKRTRHRCIFLSGLLLLLNVCSQDFPNDPYDGVYPLISFILQQTDSSTTTTASFSVSQVDLAGSSSVLLTSQIIVTFSAAASSSTLTSQSAEGSCSGTIQISRDSFSTCEGLSISLSSDGLNATLTPTYSLNDAGTYYVKVTASAAGQSGTSLGSVYTSSSFSTETLPIMGNLQVWYKANAISGVTSGNPLSSWNDSSANSWSADQATGGSQPDYKTGIINGKPVVEFSGAQFLGLPAASLGMSNGVNGMSVIAVVQSTTTGALANIIDLNTTGIKSRFNLLREDFAVGTIEIEGRKLDGDAIQSLNGGTFTTGVFTIDTGTFDYTADDAYLYQGGTQVASNLSMTWGAGTASTTSNSANISIGSRADGTAEFLTGQIAEIIIYNKTITSTEQSQIECFLSRKYNLTVSHSC